MRRYGFKRTLHPQKQGPKKFEPKRHKRIAKFKYFGKTRGSVTQGESRRHGPKVPHPPQFSAPICQPFRGIHLHKSQYQVRQTCQFNFCHGRIVGDCHKLNAHVFKASRNLGKKTGHPQWILTVEDGFAPSSYLPRWFCHVFTLGMFCLWHIVVQNSKCP